MTALMGCFRAAALALACLCALSCFTSAAQADERTPAQVEARAEIGYGRLIFKFETMPKIESGITAGVLVINFSAPVAIELKDVLRYLPAYVGIARADPDGRAIRLGLNRSFRSNAMEAGDRLFVDLLPPEWRGAPPAPPQDVIRELAEKAAAAEAAAREETRQKALAREGATLEIEAGAYPTFSRIVFDWSHFSTASLTRLGNKVTIAFNRKVRAKLGRLKSDPPPNLRGAEQRDTPDGMEIVLTVDEEIGVRGFREGKAFVVDLSGPGEAVSLSDKPADEKPAEEKPAGDKPADEKPSDPKPAEANAAEAKPVKELEDAPAEAVVKSEAKAQEAAPAEPNEAAAKQEPAEPSPDPAASLEGSNAEPKKAKADPAAPVVASIARTDDALKITLPFSAPTPAAIFRRARTIWIVLETDAVLDLAALEAAKDDRIERIDSLRSGPIQIVRIALSETHLAFAESHSTSWIVTIGDEAGDLAKPVNFLRSQNDDRDALVTVPFPGASRVHWLDDAAVGDRLAVVTSMPPAHNVNKPREFVDFEALETATGLALAARSDDLTVRVAVDQVLITRKNGLTLSPGEAGHYVAGRSPLSTPVAKFFEALRAPQSKDPGALRDELAEIAGRVALANPEARNPARIELARAYLGEGMAAEALGLLGQVQRDDAEAVSDPVFLALKGVALTLMRRPNLARQMLGEHALSRNPDASLWRGLVAMAENKPAEALKEFEAGREVLPLYAPGLQGRFRLAALKAALAANDETRAAAELSGLEQFRELPAHFRAEKHLLAGQYFARNGRTGEAMKALSAAKEAGNGSVAAEAELELIGLQLASGERKTADAIPQLEGLSISWRGDDVEARTLRLLAKTALAEKRYGESFQTMKSAVRFHPNSKVSRQIQDDMRDAFEDLFLRDGAKSLDTVNALGLYYAYRELTPPGPLGDEMIRRLADRLIEVDLLDQATKLLSHQVTKRLAGAARAQVATRLAMVELMNRRPEQALKAIRETRQSGLPEDVRLSRTLLEARALAELGRAESAMELLTDVDGAQVEQIRADALWTAQKWGAAGEQIEKMLGKRWHEGEALAAQERFDVLRAAVSFAMEEDKFALERLRRKFYAKMVTTPDAGTFLLITESNSPSKAADLRSLARQIAGTDTLDAFLRDYRARFDAPSRPIEAVPSGAKNQEARVGGSG